MHPAALILALGSLATETPPPAPGVDVTIDGLKSTAPAEWRAEKPANRLREHQFRLPRAAGDKEDAELFVMKIIQGNAEDNLARLRDLFILPTRMPKKDAQREYEIKNSKATLYCLDIQGTYHVKNKPIDQAVKEVRPDYRMIAAMWISRDAGYSIRLVGPKKTIEQHAKGFDDWLRNFK